MASAFSVHSATALPKQDRSKKCLRLLIVEENQNTAYLIRKCLERAGHLVTVCYNAEAALHGLRFRSFDLIATGQVLPGLNGLDFLHMLRRQGNNTPAIMVSGCQDDLLIAQARHAGALDFVVKDRDRAFLTELPQRVSQTLMRFRARNPHAASETRPVKSGDTAADAKLSNTLAEHVTTATPCAKLEALIDEVRADLKRRGVPYLLENVQAYVGANLDRMTAAPYADKLQTYGEWTAHSTWRGNSSGDLWRD